MLVGGHRARAGAALSGCSAERVAVEDARPGAPPASTRLATTSGMVPGALGRGEQQLFQLARGQLVELLLGSSRSALVFSMISFEPASAASVLSAPVRWPVCSGVTSVSDVQSARLALVATGPSRPSRWPGTPEPPFRRRGRSSKPSLALRSGRSVADAGPPADAGAATAAPPATSRQPGTAHRIEARMPGTYLKVSAIDSQGADAVVTERLSMRRISVSRFIRRFWSRSFLPAWPGSPARRGSAVAACRTATAASGMCSATGETTEGGRCVAPGSTMHRVRGGRDGRQRPARMARPARPDGRGRAGGAAARAESAARPRPAAGRRTRTPADAARGCDSGGGDGGGDGRRRRRRATRRSAGGSGARAQLAPIEADVGRISYSRVPLPVLSVTDRRARGRSWRAPAAPRWRCGRP